MCFVDKNLVYFMTKTNRGVVERDCCQKVIGRVFRVTRVNSKMTTLKDLVLDEDNMSNDTDVVEYIDTVDENDSDGGEKRPIMLLLRSLIRNKQNTVMSNAQIIDILQREFNIDVNSIHELEVDIYIKIIKKYLKDWPQWEELERMSTKLSNINDFEAVSKVLDHKYKNLKEYLSVMLEAAKPLAKEALKNLASEKKAEDSIDSDVVMEIQCTRQQLNQLFFRKPRLDLNYTVFNMNPEPPTQILLKTLPFDLILGYLPIKITINAPCLSMTREILYNLKHVLVNKARREKTPQIIAMNTCLQVRPKPKPTLCNKNFLLRIISNILEQCKAENDSLYGLALAVFDIIIRDLEDFPKGIRLQNMYRKYMSQYKYVRHLFVENKTSNDMKYDLQLEETLSPMYQICLKKMPQVCLEKPHVSWFKIECAVCLVKFSDANMKMYEVIQYHYNSCHQNEPEWQCMNCGKKCSPDYLAKNRFAHAC